MSQQAVIDSHHFARNRGSLIGTIALAELGRLTDSLTDSLRNKAAVLDYEIIGCSVASGSRVDSQTDRPALRVLIRGHLQLKCQRCLEPLEFPLQIDSLLLLAESEHDFNNVEEVDNDKQDWLLASGKTNVVQLVEDEILLSLPVWPRHDICAIPYRNSSNVLPLKPLAGLRSEFGK